MEADEAVKVAALVKVSMLAGIRTALKRGISIEQVLDRYEYSTFSFDKDGNFILVPSAKRT